MNNKTPIAVQVMVQADGLTEGKEYPIYDVEFHNGKVNSFRMYKDKGHYAFCLAEGCAHAPGHRYPYKFIYE